MPRFRIVVAVDLSEYAQIVVDYALDQAARHDGPDIHFLTVVDPGARSASSRRTGKHACTFRAHLIVVGRFGVHDHGKKLGTIATSTRAAAALRCAPNPTANVGSVKPTAVTASFRATSHRRGLQAA